MKLPTCGCFMLQLLFAVANPGNSLSTAAQTTSRI